MADSILSLVDFYNETALAEKGTNGGTGIPRATINFPLFRYPRRRAKINADLHRSFCARESRERFPTKFLVKIGPIKVRPFRCAKDRGTYR